MRKWEALRSWCSPVPDPPDLSLRFLVPQDLPEVERLLKECFPKDYSNTWYDDIASKRGRFCAVGGVIDGRIVGVVIAKTRTYLRLPKKILAKKSRGSTNRICYVFFLCVPEDFRRKGIASRLLEKVTSHLSCDGGRVKAVYLHVQKTNSNVIALYERNGFQQHCLTEFRHNIRGRGGE